MKYFKNLYKNNSGAVAIIFSLSLIPALGLMSSAVDFSRLVEADAKMQDALDAAVLAASKLAFEGKNTTVQENTANATFQAHCTGACQNVTFISIKNVNGQIVGEAEAKIDTSILKVLGINALTYKARSVAGQSRPRYVDIYFIVDMSASMNLPDSLSQINAFGNEFTLGGGCAFACHYGFSGSGWGFINGKTGYEIARDNNIYLREDRVRDSLVEFINYVENSPVSAAMRIALYRSTERLTLIQSMTNDWTALKREARNIGGTSEYTHYTLDDMASVLGSQGDGTQANPEKIVVYVTDGIFADDPSITNPSVIVYDTDGDISQTIRSAKCNDIKQNGAFKLGIINILYPDVSEFQLGGRSRAYMQPAIDDAPLTLQACATDDMYFNAKFDNSVRDAFLSVAKNVKPEVRPALVE